MFHCVCVSYCHCTSQNVSTNILWNNVSLVKFKTQFFVKSFLQIIKCNIFQQCPKSDQYYLWKYSKWKAKNTLTPRMQNNHKEKSFITKTQINSKTSIIHGYIRFIHNDKHASIRLLQQCFVQKHRRRKPRQCPPWNPSVMHTEAQLVLLTQSPLNLWLFDSHVLASATFSAAMSSISTIKKVENSLKKPPAIL